MRLLEQTNRLQTLSKLWLLQMELHPRGQQRHRKEPTRDRSVRQRQGQPELEPRRLEQRELLEQFEHRCSMKRRCSSHLLLERRQMVQLPRVSRQLLRRPRDLRWRLV